MSNSNDVTLHMWTSCFNVLTMKCGVVGATSHVLPSLPLPTWQKKPKLVKDKRQKIKLKNCITKEVVFVISKKKEVVFVVKKDTSQIV